MFNLYLYYISYLQYFNNYRFYFYKNSSVKLKKIKLLFSNTFYFLSFICTIMTSSTTIRLDDDLKRKMQKILDAAGLSMNAYFVMAAKQLVLQKKFLLKS